MRKFVLISDLHAHTWAAFAKGDGTYNSRLRRSLAVLDESLRRARELGVPWVFAGDLVHTAGYTLNVVMTALSEVLAHHGSVQKIVVWGNHDARGIGGRIRVEHTIWPSLLRGVSNLSVLDPTVTTLVTGGGLSFSGAGYQPREEFLTLPETSDIGIYHQTLRGTVAPNGFELEGIEPDALVDRHKLVIVGHVHHPQVRAGFFVPGSPEHQNFGDRGRHGWWVVSVPKTGTPTYEFVDGGSPQFLTVETGDDVKDDGNFYRVRHPGSNVPPGATVIAPSPTVVTSREVFHGAAGPGMVAAWLRENPPKGDRGAYQEVGLNLIRSTEPSVLQPWRLEHANLWNFCSYHDAAFPIQDGVWLVMGKGRDFPSNGAGKSTLFEAIFWTLFGRTTKGLTGDDVIKWGEKDCVVSCRFKHPDGRYLSVTRQRGTHAGLEIHERGSLNDEAVLWEGASSTDLTDRLQERLGVTPDLFQTLAYFSQERLLLFASATDGERKAMLADLMGLNAYQAASRLAGEKVERLQGGLTITKTRISDQETALQDTKERLITVDAEFREWEMDRTERHKTAMKALREFEGEREYIAQEHLNNLIKATTITLDDRLEHFRRLETELRTELEGVVLGTSDDLREEIERRRSALATATEFLRMMEKEEAAAAASYNVIQRRSKVQRDALEQSICPVCRQPITPGVFDECVREMEAETTTAGQTLDAIRQRIPEQQELVQHAQHLLMESQQKLEEAVEVEQYAADLVGVVEELSSLEKTRTQMTDHLRQQVDAEMVKRQQELMVTVRAIDAELNPYGRERDVLANIATKIKQEITRLKKSIKVDEQEIAVHDYWRIGFSKQGIQSLLMDQIAARFNDARGSIFPSLTQGTYDVQFSTVSQTKKGEWRERTAFQVLEHGVEVPYASLSGGQRRRVDVGVMLTLVKAVSEWAQVPGVVGILILDEVFGFLDASGAEGLVEALREVQESVPSIYAVTHDPQLQALFPTVITVTQDDDGVSHIGASE